MPAHLYSRSRARPTVLVSCSTFRDCYHCPTTITTFGVAGGRRSRIHRSLEKRLRGARGGGKLRPRGSGGDSLAVATTLVTRRWIRAAAARRKRIDGTTDIRAACDVSRSAAEQVCTTYSTNVTSPCVRHRAAPT